MDLKITISQFEVEIRPTVREDNLKAFVNWKFITSVGTLKIACGTLRLKEFGEEEAKKKVLTYNPPAIKTRTRFNTVFFLDNLEIFKRLCAYTIKKYCEQTGEIEESYGESFEKEEVSPDEIPF